MLITLEYINQLRHIASGAGDGDGEGVYVDMLQALVPILPPMVGAVVSEFLQDQDRTPLITMEDLQHERPDYP